MNKALLHIFFLLLSGLFIGIAGLPRLQAQPSCEISIDKPLPVCPRSKFQLSVPEGEGYKYLWTTIEGTVLDSTSSILLKLEETTEIIVRVTDTINFEECESDPFEVTVHTRIEVGFEQLQLTCTQTFLDLQDHPGAEDKTRTAVAKATASGEFEADEYHYFWDVQPKQIAPGDSSTALGLRAHQFYDIVVKDNYGCGFDTSFWTKAYDNPLAEIFADPDTAYIKKPFITFSFTNLSADSIDIINYFWEIEIGDPFYPDSVINSDLPDPVVTFPKVGSYPAFLTIYNPQGCDTMYSHEIEVKPVELFIPNVFTPNGDGTNDDFEIAMLEGGSSKNTEIFLNEYYISSKLVVFNRWGKAVFESDDYQNDWDGGELPDGVYYYVLKCVGYNSPKPDVFKGAVTIVASGRQN